ncbi:MAG TPA: DivIVA domain-containing protein [Gaiellaceae bacterium]
MRYTPVELRHVRIGRSLFGYKRGDVDSLLEDVADSYEEVWRERGELTDRVEDVEKRLGEFKDREQLLATTLVSAEKAAAEAKDGARREAELIVAEAHGEARSIMRTAQNERERLFGEARRVEALLRAALGMVEESKAEPLEDGEAPEDFEKPWPLHEDTSEFEAILSPGLAASAREAAQADEPEATAEPEPEAEPQPQAEQAPEPGAEGPDEPDAAEEPGETEGRVALPPVAEDDDDPWSTH